MNRNELAEAFSALKTAKLPPPPDSGDLEDWRANLIETDAFYAGIASTVLNEGPVEHDLGELDTLEATLQSLSPRSDQDREMLRASHSYLQLLKRVRQELIRVSEGI